jgi:excisionase family DNA binding protein
MQDDGEELIRSWLTAKQAAELVGISLNTLYIYCARRRRKPPFVRLGGAERGRYRFPKDKFIEWASGSKGN